MRLLLAGGGTGGHLFPAVALAQKLLEEEWQAQVLFVGTERGVEAEVLPRLGLPLQTIDIAGFVGKGWGEKLALVPRLVRSIWQAREILERFAPDVVVGVGGYASGPVLLAARMKKIPFIIHEQNADFGLTNRIMARWARRVCISLPGRKPGGKGEPAVVLTGNPVRKGMTDCPPLSSEQPLVLIFGGSRGARAINDAVLAALPALRELCPEVVLLHQTGTEDLERVREGYRQAGCDPGQVTAFIEEMAAAYARAHLVVCRAGATSIAELTACGRPAILVPYPHAAADHQTANARVLAEKGAALLLPQGELRGEPLARLIAGLLADRKTLERMGEISRSLANPAATERLLEECRAVARGE